jgi:hypothetical protein
MRATFVLFEFIYSNVWEDNAGRTCGRLIARTYFKTNGINPMVYFKRS